MPQRHTVLQLIPSLVLLAVAWAANADSASPSTAGSAHRTAAIDAAKLLHHIKVLSSDAFEGRSPGSHGETITVDYLIEQFKALGLKPGNPDGTYTQTVPMNAYASQPSARFNVGPKHIDLKYPADFVAWSEHRKPLVKVANSPLVFVGYGVQAPEYGWDDYKGVNVRGKTIVMLINDPPIPDPNDPSKLDPKMFGGKAMTYYGRWTYKYEIAAKLGAAAAIIVHESGPAAYPYSVVVSSWTKENFSLSAQPPNVEFPTVPAWITLDRAKELFTAAGQDFDALKVAAVRKDFKPVVLGATVTFNIRNAWREVASHNVVAKIEGSDPRLKHEWVIYTAHWDHFGWDKKLPGTKHNQIYHGARDNGSGTAALLDLARAFKALPQPPKRSILFIATTGEERGLLGARYYAAHPLYPLRQTLADINFDTVNKWGRTRDIETIGFGKTTLDDTLSAAAAAAARGRVTKPASHPELGSVYRADQLEFAKRGVPVLYAQTGTDFVGKPPGYGDQKIAEYIAHDYHQVTDTVGPDWDLSGAAEDVDLLFDVGNSLAQGAAFPQWKQGAEFKGLRDKMMSRARRDPSLTHPGRCTRARWAPA